MEQEKVKKGCELQALCTYVHWQLLFKMMIRIHRKALKCKETQRCELQVTGRTSGFLLRVLAVRQITSKQRM